MSRLLTLVAVLAILAPAARAQLPLVLSDEAEFSLLTIYPGDAVYSLWGHSAVRVQDPLTGLDASFNYGTFRFDEWFVPRFVYGKLDYELSVQSFPHALEGYRDVEQRPVVEQKLRLSPAQKDGLFQFLRTNALPENRVYRYDFLFDNCSTRIRDALERSLGEDVRFAEHPRPDSTFRQLIDVHLTGYDFVDAGIDLLFGSPVDRVAAPYETMFLPIYLMQAFDSASVRIDGEFQPLVARTDTLFWIEGRGLHRASFPWASLLLWILFGAAAIATITAARNARSGKREDGRSRSDVVRVEVRSGTDGVPVEGRNRRDVVRVVDVPLFTLSGLLGVLIVFLWFFSLHDVTMYNGHLLWAWPTHLIVAVRLIRRGSGIPLWIRRYALAASLMALVATTGSYFWVQEISAPAYPLMLMVALRGGWIFFAPLWRGPRVADA